MSVTTGTFPGVRIMDMPDLGAVSDTSSVVGERAGSGRFSAQAMRAYVFPSPASIAALRALSSGAPTAYVQGYYVAGDGGGGDYVRGADGADNGGSVIRSGNGTYYLQTHGAPVSVRQFGARGDGVTDDTGACQRALDASLDVIFPAGPNGAVANYRLQGTLFPRIGHRIRGGGIGVTTLLQMAGNAYTLLFQSDVLVLGNVMVADLTIRGGSSGCLGIAIELYSNVSVVNVQFAGCETMAVHIDRGYFILLDNCVSVPNTALGLKAGGFEAISSDEGNYVFYPTFRDCRVHTTEQDEPGDGVGATSPCVHFHRVIGGRIENFVAERLNFPLAASPQVAGIVLENDCQGVKITGGVTYGAHFGIGLITGESGPNSTPSFTVIDNHDIDFFTGAGILILAPDGSISVDNIITNCLLTAPQDEAYCITAENCLRLTIKGNNCDQYLDQGGFGIQISKTNTALITDNMLTNFTTGFGMVGPSGGSGGCVNVQFTNNTVQNCVNPIQGDLTGAGTGTTLIKDNVGASTWSVPLTTPPVPPSTTYIQNITGFDVMVYVYGGDSVTIGVNGQPTGIMFAVGGAEPKGGSAYVPAQATVGVAYATAPTWVWLPV
jgi:hypothetical protein